jgi:hypothetical protein
MKTKEIESYFKWYQEECTEPYSELEWLITCALDSSHKDHVIEALDQVHNHIKKRETN